MRRIWNITEFIERNIKLVSLFCCVLLLTACGDDCPTTQEATTSTCPVCVLFDILTETSKSLANSAWDDFAVSLSRVVVVVSAIYIALYTLRMVSSFGKQTLADYFTGDKRGLFIFMFKASIIYFLLAGLTPGVNDFLKYIIGPLLSAGIEIGAELSAAGSVIYESTPTIQNWDHIFDMINRATLEFNNSINFVTGLGEAMSCDAVDDAKPWNWKFLQLICGGMIFIFGWILQVTVSFYLIDVVIRLTFAAVLLPVGIAFAISNLSMPYAKNIWNLFVNVFFSLIMLGIVIGLVLQMVAHCIGGGEVPSAPSYTYDLVAAVDANKVAELTGAMAKFGHMLLVFICFAILMQLVEQMGKIAGEVSDTASAAEMTSGQQAFAPMGKIATNMAKEATTWAGNAVTEVGKHVGHDVSRATRMDKLYKWGKNRFDKVVRGEMLGVGAHGHRAFWRNWFR